MNEDSPFWYWLCQHVTGALKALHDNNRWAMWVDVIMPDIPHLEPGAHAMPATAWVWDDKARSFVVYRTILSMSRRAAEAYRRGEWEKLLPEPDTTGWLTFSRADKEIRIRLTLRPQPA